MPYFGASLLVLFGLVNSLRSSDITNGSYIASVGPRVKLEILPPLTDGTSPRSILARTHGSLNMTCAAVYQNVNKNDTLLDYDVDWKVPFHVKNNALSKIQSGQGRNIAWLWFERLQDGDAGEYTCVAVPSKSESKQFLTTVIQLSVKGKQLYCGEKWFRCRMTHCIMERYVCDGKADCKDGEDESPDAGCGPNPCLGKIQCEDRCIPPEWCCDHTNCSTLRLNPRPPPSHEISYVQTAFYTVIGCAMAFMFIVTILVIAICRVQIKRAMNSRWTQQNTSDCSRRRTVPLGMPIYDLDVFLNRNENYTPGVSIMYNINSGVQFVGRPVEPPPYSEAIAVPPREGPPPPYVSCENLIEETTTASRILDRTNVNESGNISTTTANQGDIHNSNDQTDSVNFIGDSLSREHDPIVSHLASENFVDSNLRGHANTCVPIENLSLQNFNSEPVETDALLSESRQCNIVSSKELWWQSHGPKKNCPIQFHQKAEGNFSSLPVRNKNSTLGNCANEGVFLEIEQRNNQEEEAGPSSLTCVLELPLTKKIQHPRTENSKEKSKVNNSISTAGFSETPSVVLDEKVGPSYDDSNSSVEFSTQISDATVASSNQQNDTDVQTHANESRLLPLRESFRVQKDSYEKYK